MVKGSHSFRWSSSPKLPNGSYLVNEKVKHGLIFSGMRPSHYDRFAKGAGIGYINAVTRIKFVGEMKPVIEEEYLDNTDTALLEEIARYCPEPTVSGQGENRDEISESIPCEVDNDDWYGIDILTDARHGHRKNAKDIDSSIVAIGEKLAKCYTMHM